MGGHAAGCGPVRVGKGGCHPRLPVTTRDAREPPAPQGPSRCAVALRASPCPPGEPPGMAAPARPTRMTPGTTRP